MTAIEIIYGLPFVNVNLIANGKSLQIDHVLLDTGSAASLFRTDDLLKTGILIQPTDRIRYMSGVGGQEPVIEKHIEAIEVGLLSASPFTIQLGALDYGFQMNGILGLDFLTQVQAVIDFKSMTLIPSQ